MDGGVGGGGAGRGGSSPGRRFGAAIAGAGAVGGAATVVSGVGRVDSRSIRAARIEWLCSFSRFGCPAFCARDNVLAGVCSLLAVAGSKITPPPASEGLLLGQLGC